MGKKICCVPGCGKVVKARGYCNKHLQQVDKKGAVYSRIKLRCMVPSCKGKHVANGYCDKHYNQIRRTGATFSVLKYSGCFAPECKRKNYSQGYCSMHWRQIRDHGGLFKISRRDPNKVVFDGDMARISLYNSKMKEIGETVIDKEDYPTVKNFRWYLGAHGYATRGCKKGEVSLLHKMLLQTPQGMEVDHRDRIRLNNRKNNLRPCTRGQNCYNSSISSRNTSGVTGVSWDKKRQLWDTYISANKKFIRLGLFSDFTKAVEIRKQAETHYFKEFMPV